MSENEFTKITLDNGFEAQINEKVFDSYDFTEAIYEVQTNPSLFPKVLILLLGKEQHQKLKEALRSEDGLITNEAMSEAFTEIVDKCKAGKKS